MSEAGKYGFLFSDSVGEVEAEGLAQVLCGFAQRQSVDGGPEVQDVALGAALGAEAAEDVLLQVDGERPAAGVRRAVYRARAAALGSPAAEAIQVSQVPQHLLHRDLAAERGEVDPRRPLGRAAGLAAGAAFLQLPVPRGKDPVFPPGQLVRGRDVAQRAVEPHLVVVFHVPGHDAPGVLQGQGRVPPDAHDLAWEIPAWLMLPDTSIQKAVLLTGQGANGKSTWLNLVSTFLGKRNTSGVSLHKLEADKFAALRLIGKLANICPDLPSEHLAGTSVFKAITGGDTLPAEYKFKDSFDFTPYARLVFSANHSPRSSDSSHAFLRCWLVVPFDRTFAPNEQIPRDILDATLAAPTELSGMLNRALDALDRLRINRRFSESESVQRAWEDFHAETDPLAVWLDHATIEITDAATPKTALLAAYSRHGASNGLPTIGSKRFGQSLRRLRPNVGDGQRMINGKYTWCYLGIALAEDRTHHTGCTGCTGYRQSEMCVAVCRPYDLPEALIPQPLGLRHGDARSAVWRQLTTG